MGLVCICKEINKVRMAKKIKKIRRIRIFSILKFKIIKKLCRMKIRRQETRVKMWMPKCSKSSQANKSFQAEQASSPADSCAQK